MMDDDLLNTWCGAKSYPVDTISWKCGRNGEVPAGAIIGGRTANQEATYIGRMKLRENYGGFMPGVLIPSKKCLQVSYGTGVKTSSEYEVLVSTDDNSFHWVPCSGGDVPANAVIGGLDCSYHEQLYVGRTVGSLDHGRTWRGRRLQNDSTVQGPIPGKIHRSHKCLYVPVDGKEYLFRKYEVLVLKADPACLQELCRHSIRKCLQLNCSGSAESNLATTEAALSEKFTALPLPDKLKEFCKDRFCDFWLGQVISGAISAEQEGELAQS